MSDKNFLNDLDDDLFKDEVSSALKENNIDEDTLNSISLDLEMEKSELKSIMDNLEEIHMDGILSGSFSDLQDDLSDQELDALLSSVEDDDMPDVDDAFMKGYRIASPVKEDAPLMDDGFGYTDETGEADAFTDISFDGDAQYGGGIFEDADFDFSTDEPSLPDFQVESAAPDFPMQDLPTELPDSGLPPLPKSHDDLGEFLPPLADDDIMSAPELDGLESLLNDDDFKLPPLEKKKGFALANSIKSFAESVKTTLNAQLNKIDAAVKAGRAKLKKFEKSVIIMGTVILIMGSCLIISGSFLLKDFLYLRKLIRENKVIINSSNSRPFNNANYIYTSNIKTINGNELILRKIKLDKHANAFYFSKYLPLDNFELELIDDNGNYYVYNSRLSSSINDEDLVSPTVLWFEGLKEGASELTLSIWDTETKDLAEYEIVIEDHTLLPVQYLTSEQADVSYKYGIVVRVEEAVFSTAKSEISYKIESSEEIALRHGGPSAKNPSDYLSLQGSTSIGVPLSKEPYIIHDENNLTAGFMEFSALPRPADGASLTFRSLFIGFDINETVSAESLFRNEEGVEIIVDMGKDRLVLERLRKFDEAYVLVYHFESAETGERVMGEADLDMTVRKGGESVTLTPYVYSNNFGGDMIFEYDTPNAIIDDATPEDVFLNIKTANITLPDMTVKIDGQFLTDNSVGGNYSFVKNKVKEAFIARFEYLSGVADHDMSAYFDEAMLNNEQISSLYENPGATEPPKYGVLVRSIIRTSEDEFLAVVDEAWRFTKGDDRIYGSKKHNVTVKQYGDSYVIIGDEAEQL